MPTAKAILVGLAHVDPNKYYGSSLDKGCTLAEQNAGNMYALLKAQGFDCMQPLLTDRAKAQAILDALQPATGLQTGDIFVFYFAGHGLGGGANEPAHTLAAYDRQIDTYDEIRRPIWLKCQPGVRIVMICDCCNAGTNYTAQIRLLIRELRHSLAAGMKLLAGAPDPPMQAQMIHFAAAKDASDAIDGLFTQALLDVWAGGQFNGYRDFFCRTLWEVMQRNSPQAPEYLPYGPVTDTYEAQKPFTIGAPSASNQVITTGITGWQDCAASSTRHQRASRASRWRAHMPWVRFRAVPPSGKGMKDANVAKGLAAPTGDL